MTLERIEAARPLPGYRLHLRFADSAEGVADLSHLVVQGGVFAALQADFSGVRVIEDGRAVAWRDSDGGDVDLCADALRRMVQENRAAAE